MSKKILLIMLLLGILPIGPVTVQAQSLPTCTPAPALDISASPDTFIVQPNETLNSTLTITPLDSFKGGVTISTINVPANIIKLTLAPTSLDLSNGPQNSVLAFSTSASIAPDGDYSFDIKATANSIQPNSITINVFGATPRVEISVSNSLPPIKEPASATFPVNLTSLYGATGIVNVTSTVRAPTKGLQPPTPPTLSPTLVSVALTAAMPVTRQNFTVSTTTSTTPDRYTLEFDVVNATTGYLLNSTLAFLTVSGPDFTINIQPRTLMVPPGPPQTSTITVTSILGFSGTVILTTSVPSLGRTSPDVRVTPATVIEGSGSYFTSLYVNATSNTTPGQYQVTVSAMSGAIMHQAIVFVTVPGFAMDASPGNIRLYPGTTDLTTITIKSLNGVNGILNLSLSCSPEALIAGLDKASLALTGGQTALTSLTVSVPTSTLPGLYQIVVVGNEASSPVISNSTTVTITIVPRATTTRVACNASVDVTTNASCTIIVTDTSPGTSPTPSGSVSLMTNSTGQFEARPCILMGVFANASCILGYVPMIRGGHRITANYSGDIRHTASFGYFTISAMPPSPKDTTTIVVCSSPVLFSLASTCTSKVLGASTSGATSPSGTVTFDSTGIPGMLTPLSCQLAASTVPGSASCTVRFVPSVPGTAAINASYPGDNNYASSSSPPTIVTVNARPTTISIFCNNPIPLNEVASCTVTVMDSPTKGTPTTPAGTVSFNSKGPISLESSACSLNTGTCEVNFVGSTVGSATMEAIYEGDIYHSGNNSNIASISVSKRTSATSLSCNNPLLIGRYSTCTVIVNDASTGTTITPTGTVDFASTVAGSLSAPSCFLLNGACSITVAGSRTGTTVVNATYEGDSGHNGSTSSRANITVNAPPVSQAPTIFGLEARVFYEILSGVIGVVAVGVVAAVFLRRKKV